MFFNRKRRNGDGPLVDDGPFGRLLTGALLVIRTHSIEGGLDGKAENFTIFLYSEGEGRHVTTSEETSSGTDYLKRETGAKQRKRSSRGECATLRLHP